MSEVQDNLGVPTVKKPLDQVLAVLPYSLREQGSTQEIAGMLPAILARVRVLWSASPFFGTPQSITNLLRRFSHQIITICSRSISVSDALSGDVNAAMTNLQVSFWCLPPTNATLHSNRTVCSTATAIVLSYA